MFYKKLNNGIRVVGEKLPHLHSINLGIWVNVGSSNENENENGLSHFIEHLVFKGTKHRRAKEIAEEMDSIGANLNAFTGKNCTCYYVRALKEDLNQSLNMLWDLVYNPTFNEVDIDKERGVVLEEIAMNNDNPEDIVANLAAESIHCGSLQRPILGTYDKIKNYTRDDIVAYWKSHYIPKNMVIAIVGNFEEEDFTLEVEQLFGHIDSASSALVPQENTLIQSYKFIKKDIEQTHIILSFPGLAFGSDNEQALNIMSTIFGGGMSSRLFQKIREELGIAYSVYSYMGSYKTLGTFNIYVGTNPNEVLTVLKAIKEEIENLCEKGILEQELKSSKALFRASIEFGLESTSARMSRIGKTILMKDDVKDIDEVLSDILNTSKNDVEVMVQRIFSNKPSIAIVGPNDENILDEIKILFE